MEVMETLESIDYSIQLETIISNQDILILNFEKLTYILEFISFALIIITLALFIKVVIDFV